MAREFVTNMDESFTNTILVNINYYTYFSSSNIMESSNSFKLIHSHSVITLYSLAHLTDVLIFTLVTIVFIKYI
ncbi:hypothetical protein DICVIV_08911 [Dictyocaulus viviparus]|uniref:Uncharacterized protein n=1 Tax=Dictyocaulus viviparus TaxID=29172 RepID=A0A0D8XK91_DICVI|nr:hypothetical protein DICVIV_08911 [Dictyocaulus viviparus]